MLIQFTKETSGRATGDYQPGRSHMREGASRNRYSPGSEADAAFRERIACRVFGFITLVLFFFTPLILAGIAVKFR